MNTQTAQTYYRGIKFILFELEDELSTRTGYTINEYKIILNKIDNCDASNLVFNEEENIMISQMFNEICNGINIPEFSSEIGVSKKEARVMLEEIFQKINK